MGKYTELQREAYEANMQIPAQHLALYTWGNVSAFDKAAGVFAIKPSGVPYPELTPESMVIVDLEGNVVEGKLRPSSDTVYPVIWTGSMTSKTKTYCTPEVKLIAPETDYFTFSTAVRSALSADL